MTEWLPIQGLGAFARVPIKQGEVVEILGGVVMTEGEFRLRADCPSL